MSYRKNLSKMVQNSGMTLKEISEKCMELGVKINPSYISKLQSESQAPASDDINIALSKVCGIDPDILIFEAYKEKAPPIVKNFLELILCEMRKAEDAISKNIISNMDLSDEDKRLYNEEKVYTSDLFIINKYLEDPSLFQMIYSLVGMVQNKLIDDPEETSKINGLLGLFDKWGYDNKEIDERTLPLRNRHILIDDSMAPRIPKGSLVNYVSPEYISNGDIVVCEKTSGNEVLVRRYIEFGKIVLLISENLSYRPIKFEPEDYSLLGKVDKITINI